MTTEEFTAWIEAEERREGATKKRMVNETLAILLANPATPKQALDDYRRFMADMRRDEDEQDE